MARIAAIRSGSASAQRRTPCFWSDIFHRLVENGEVSRGRTTSELLSGRHWSSHDDHFCDRNTGSTLELPAASDQRRKKEVRRPFEVPPGTAETGPRPSIRDHTRSVSGDIRPPCVATRFSFLERGANVQRGLGTLRSRSPIRGDLRHNCRALSDVAASASIWTVAPPSCKKPAA